MKRILLAVGVVIGIHLGAVSVLQAATTADEIAAIDKRWAEAYVGCDTKVWEALLSDDLVFIHTGGTVDDRAAQVASIKACPLESLKSAVTKVRMYGDDTAVVLGNMQGKVKGRDFRFDLLYTRVYILQNGVWRLVTHQSTDAPKKGA